MKSIELWQDDREKYTLKNGYKLISAPKDDFAIHYTVYSNTDLELWYSWENQLRDNSGFSHRFWIIKDSRRIGGVVIRPNLLTHLFLEPPYLVDKFMIISELTNALLFWSDRSKRIQLVDVLPEDIDYFHKLGFRILRSRRNMIRPTEEFDTIKWNDDYIVEAPEPADAVVIGKLLVEANRGGLDFEIFGGCSLEQAIDKAERLIDIFTSTGSIDGSCLVYEKKSNELIGFCLAGIYPYEDNYFSGVAEISVKPSYRGYGIATNMLKRALTNLKDISPALKLCVTIGNPAETVYTKLGFMSGIKFTSMYMDLE